MTPAARVPVLVEVERVNADRSVRAIVDGGRMETVSLDRLDRWMRAGVPIRPVGGWQ